MPEFRTKIEGHGDKEFYFDCHENTEPIEMDDIYIYFFGNSLMGFVADVMRCSSETEKLEINANDRKRDHTKIDLVTGFWKNCYKIKETDFDLEKIE